ncbi:MAG: V-type ATP synthase subunit E [Firmicutes bacterium]|nr:V-type ATP synthase subunit E [Bacillota bacterium]
MTGIDNIKGRIMADAEAKASEIVDDAEIKAEEILAKAKEKAVDKVKEIERKSIYDANERKRIIHSMVELSIRKDILAAKQEVLCQVFDEVQERIDALTGDEYEKILISMLLKTIEPGNEDIVISKNDVSRISPEFVKKVNEEFKKAGKSIELKMKMEDVEFGGGFIIKGKGIEINNSFKALLNMKRDEIEPIVAEMLF